MKKNLITLMALLICTVGFAQNFNMTLRAVLPYGVSLSNIGGYVDSQGNEYALVGYYEGLSIVDVTDPDNPVEAFMIPGAQSDWREVKVWDTYAYVTTEGGNTGLQIVDLSDLPNSVNSKYWAGSGAINNQLETIHALHIDAAHVYLFGSNLFNGSALVVDLADPWNPVYKGHTPGTYIHDGYVRNDTLWGGHIYDGYFAVYNVADKTNPILLAQQNTPNNFTHNTWLNDAGTVLFTTDETNDSYLTSYDITDLGNITELDRYQITPGSGSIVHNTHVLNDFAVTSWYKDGVSITDVSRPENIISVGSYDTYTQGAGGGFDGCWGVYPFLPSGTIVASDMANGLVVLTPTYIRACYLEGIVTDSVSGLALGNATVQVLTTALAPVTNITGEYKTGTVTPGTVSIQVSRAGYETKTITGIVLVNGQLTVVDVELNPLNAFTATGQVIDAVSGLPVPNAKVQIWNASTDNQITADANGNFAIPAFFPDNYNIDAGKWGYVTYCSNSQALNSGTVPYVIQLQPGIYDDFTFDLGWTVTGASGNSWERGEPDGTVTQGPGGGAVANPDVDVTNDCRDKCYVTDNGGGGAWDNDVDGGNTILTSPIFDATSFLNPDVKYARWFYNGGNNGGGSADDTLTVKITNGITTVTLETLFPNSPNNSSWVNRTYSIAQYLTPTANMKLIVETADWGPVFNIVEGGLDKFEVTEGPVSIAENIALAKLSAYPNPFNNAVRIVFNSNLLVGETTLVIADISGRIISNEIIDATKGYVDAGSDLAAGIYTAQLINKGVASSPVKITKVK
ncbi:MAG: choice-of-anchor B family protein [Bacteroidetes bacterium]|nr:choice-of-anchor B family protein [Bacteroidota bacterium]